MVDVATGALGVVVVNYGSHALLERNLTKVARSLPGAQVVVVDNYFTDAERVAVRRLASAEGWYVIAPATNLGFGAGMNLGAERAIELGAGRLLLLNPDATVDARSVGLMEESLEGEPVALVAPVVHDAHGGVWSAGTDLYLADGRMRSPRHRGRNSGQARRYWLSGACLLIGVPLWERLGGFDEDYFLYWEDVDLSIRVVELGGHLVLREDATAVHDEGGTQARNSTTAKSTTYYYFNVRNRLVFAAKRLDRVHYDAWSRSSFSAARLVLLRGGRRQFLRPWAPVAAAARATRDGRRLASEILRQRGMQ